MLVEMELIKVMPKEEQKTRNEEIVVDLERIRVMRHDRIF